MPDRSHLAWPFLDDAHREHARALDEWSNARLTDHHDTDVDAACKQLVAELGQAGWLRYCAGKAWGGAYDSIDTRSLCVSRETLAWHSGLADFAFAMQGLGSGSISLAGTEAQQRRYLPDVVAGRKLAAFALSEPDAGSDVAAIATTARRDGAHWVLDGIKTWISNAGIADFYCVFARTGEAPGSRGISAFVVDAGTPGLEVVERIPVMAPHPLGTLRFSDCRVPADALLGAPGEGFKIAMRNLDIFRTSVAAASLGFARRALDEALGRATRRRMLGQTLADFQLTQVQLGAMCTEIDASALMVYRSAWTRDVQGTRVTREASMAKLYATEAAQRVIDGAVQLHGGLGVVTGIVVERLYRDVRALRIYEGASEVLQLIVGARHLQAAREAGERR